MTFVGALQLSHSYHICLLEDGYRTSTQEVDVSADIPFQAFHCAALMAFIIFHQAIALHKLPSICFLHVYLEEELKLSLVSIPEMFING